jgi:ferredoxin
MPYVLAKGKTIECVLEANLRKILLQADIDLNNNGAKVINCRGIGSCGTCAVLVEGEVSEPKKARHDTTFPASLLCHKKATVSLSNSGSRRC